MRPENSLDLEKKVAREAANLLYLGVEKEYKQAKLKAAETFGCQFLPSNLQVVIQFDNIAEIKEGKARENRLIRMRKQALELMKILKEYHPVLVGSVWRGTIHRKSDIDITLYHKDTQKILETIRQNGLKVTRTEWTTVTKKGMNKTSLHIYLELPTEEKTELIVRSPEEYSHQVRCEIYGDQITGLHIQELEELLHENPTRRFVPF